MNCFAPCIDGGLSVHLIFLLMATKLIINSRKYANGNNKNHLPIQNIFRLISTGLERTELGK
jgi:hypothetical protein